jgi:hypothetical protein
MQDSESKGISRRLVAGVRRAQAEIATGVGVLSSGLRRRAARRHYAPLSHPVSNMAEDPRPSTCIPFVWSTPECVKTPSAYLCPLLARGRKAQQEINARLRSFHGPQCEAVEPEISFANALQCVRDSSPDREVGTFTVELEHVCAGETAAIEPADDSFLQDLECARAEAEKQFLTNLLLAPAQLNRPRLDTDAI